MPSRGIEAFFFLIIIAAGLGYVLLTTRPAAPPKMKQSGIYRESHRLSIEVEKTIKFLYKSPISIFSKVSDVFIKKPRYFLDEAMSLIETVIKMEQRKAELDYRKQMLTYYLSQMRRNSRRVPDSETIDRWFLKFSSWMGKTVVPDSSGGKKKQKDLFQELFRTSRPAYLKNKPDEAIKKLLSKNRRETARVERTLIRTASRVRQDLRWAVLCSFCCMFLTIGTCGCLVAGMCLCRRYFIRDKSHLTAVQVQANVSETFFHLKKASPDAAILDRAKKEGWFSPALAEVLGVLQAYRQWPASVDSGGHGGAEGGLYRHSVGVMEKMLDNASPEMDKKEVAMCGLSHDLGKILTYGKMDGKWMKTGMYHDVLSGAILRGIPMEGFSQESITRMLLVVSHHHRPVELPVNVPPGTKEMLELLTNSDAQVARQEKQTQT